MLQRFREHFGAAGLVVAVIALVAALVGGAYAASSSSGGKATTAAKRAAKGSRGPRGATGPTGPTGAQGSAGVNGKDGAKGTTGADGADGASGMVTSSLELPGPNCTNGGVKFTSDSSSPAYACNGANGIPGQAGSPWTAGGTLPVGATEKGTWIVRGTTADEGVIGAISFGIPLAAPLDEAHVVYVSGGNNPDPTHCTGSAEDPKAESGYLCVYEILAASTGFGGVLRLDLGTPGASEAGALLFFTEPDSDAAIAVGSWAVTG